MLITHVGSGPLLAGQLLLLGVGRGQLEVEHGLQPGGASVDPLAPLVVLRNSPSNTKKGFARWFGFTLRDAQ